jgi:hypothetical protein
MPAPQPAPKPGAALESFRVRLPALWRQASAGLLAGALTSSVLLWLQGEPWGWPQTVPMTLAAAVGTAISFVLQPTQAGAAGLYVLSTWGFRKRLAWAEVRGAVLARQYGLWPAFKLHDERGRAYWISRDTTRLDRLHALALQHGGPAHPLVQVLQTPLYAA